MAHFSPGLPIQSGRVNAFCWSIVIRTPLLICFGRSPSATQNVTMTVCSNSVYCADILEEKNPQHYMCKTKCETDTMYRYDVFVMKN